MAKAKKKKGFLEGYKTYDPDKEGYGDASQWNAAFSERMGLNQARQTLKDKDPLTVLGLSVGASWEEVKKAYRQKVMEFHPDRNPGNVAEARAKFDQVQAAYEILEDRYK